MTADEMDQILARCPGGTMSELSAIHRGPASVDIVCSRPADDARPAAVIARLRQVRNEWLMVAGAVKIVAYPDVYAEIEERYRRVLDGETITPATPPLAPKVLVPPGPPPADVDQLLERALDLVGADLGTMAVDAAAGGLDHTAGGKLANYVRVLGKLVDDRHRRAPKKEGEETMHDLLNKAREIVKRHESGGV